MTTESAAAVGAQPQGPALVRGPRGVPLLGNLPQFGKDPLAFFELLRDRGGPMVSWRFGRTSCVYLSEPEHIGELMREIEGSFDQPDLGIAFRTVLGNGVTVAKGKDWRRKRSLVQPSVRPKQVKSYARTMAACAVESAASWSDGQRIDIKREMTRLTRRIAVSTIFGVDTESDSEVIGEAMEVALAEIGAEFSGLGAVLPEWVPTPGRSRIRKAAAVIDAEVGRIVAAHRDAPDERPDLLSRLLTARDETGARLTDAEIRDEAVTLYIGGHETTSSTLVWAWYLLARNPKARAALGEELDRVLGERDPGFDDYADLAYTQSVVKETLRLYPTIWLLTGLAKKGASIGGRPIPEGTRVWTSQWATHRDARWYEDADAFRPERWSGPESERIPEDAWFPFGGGPRVCLGARFAMVESVLILATIARRFDLLVDQDRLHPIPSLTLQPDREVTAVVRGRGQRG